eukprot:jgi/Psemu1/204748/e_gw1.355.58.1
MNAIATIRDDDRLQTTTADGESSSALMDSLPYVETVHEDYEEYALALIEEEMKAIAPRPMKKIFPMNFRTPAMRSEYNTLVVMEENNNAQGDGSSTRIVKPTTTEGWADAGDVLSRMKSRFEAERIRGMILEVEKEEGVANWKDFNAKLDEQGAFWTKMLKEQMDAVEEINFRRQQAQTQQVGPEIDRLTQEYEQALYRRNQLEYAIEGIKRETNAKNINDAGSENNEGDAVSRKRKN